MPFADYILFRHPTKNRVLLNIGGIANITSIPARATIDQILAWDFDRVTVTHGEVLEHGGKERLAAAFAFLPASARVGS